MGDTLVIGFHDYKWREEFDQNKNKKLEAAIFLQLQQKKKELFISESWF